MTIFKPISEKKSSKRVKRIFDEIKKTRKISFVPNFWRMLANETNRLVESYQVEVDKVYR